MNKGRRYQNLDGMRGVCSLIVAIFHTGLALGISLMPAQGWICVDMFFVLSGFVIALTYEDKLKAGNGFKGYLEARWRRLVPTQTLGTLACIVAALPAFNHANLSVTYIAIIGLTGVFLIPIVWTPLTNLALKMGVFPANPVLWSLQAEWVVNAIYGRFLYKSSVLGLVGFCFAAFFVGIILASIQVDWVFPFRSFCQAGIGFTLGVILFRLKPKISEFPEVNPILIYALWALICCIPVYSESNVYQTPVIALISTTLVALLVRSERPIGRALSYLGKLSYPLYASHMAIMNTGALLLGNRGFHNRLWAIPLLGMALALAAIIDRFVRFRHTIPAPETSEDQSGVKGS